MSDKSKNIFYFTFGESMSGVFQSQVIDVLQSIRNSSEGVQVQLYSIISPRNFIAEKRRIRESEPSAIVLPSVAPLRFFYLNKIWGTLINSLHKNGTVFSRGPLATYIALSSLKKFKIIYDGRGAVVAEQEEYGVYSNSGLENDLENLERKAVFESDFRIAVSQKLVDYWKERYNYKGNNYVVIPCTVSKKTEDLNIPHNLDKFLSVNHLNRIFTFAGGNSKWQGIEKLAEFLRIQFEKFPDTRAVLLTSENELLKELKERYPNRIIITEVLPQQVISVLSKCDYGVLFREIKITNQVASPVKIAEYLQAGLKVLISPEIGDYSEIIFKNNLGYIISSRKDYEQTFEKPNLSSKKEVKDFCSANYSKNSNLILEKYLRLLQ